MMEFIKSLLGQSTPAPNPADAMPVDTPASAAADAQPVPHGGAPTPVPTTTTPEVKPVSYIRITEAQANALRALRAIKTSDKAGYKDARASLFSNIRQALGIPDTIVLKVEVDDRASPQYLVLKGRPPKSKTAEYVPLEAGDDGRYKDAPKAQAPAQWARLPLADVVALLREQGETMEGYTVHGPLAPATMTSLIPSESRTELAVDVDDNLYFRIDA